MNTLPRHSPSGGKCFLIFIFIFRSLESVELYEKALSFMQRGKGHGTEGRKAAYRLLDQAAEMGNKDAMKLMGKCLSSMLQFRVKPFPICLAIVLAGHQIQH